MRFSIVIASWKDYKYLQLLLESLTKNSTYEHDIVIHLNEESEETIELVKGYGADFSHTKSNMGLAYANNVCVERSKNDYIFIMNSDMVFLPKWDYYLEIAVKRFGQGNVYSSTMIEPYGQNQFYYIKDYGREPETFNRNLITEVEAYRNDQYYKAINGANLLRRELYVPMDERLWPGYVTDCDFVTSMYTQDPDTRFIAVNDSILYHFISKASSNMDSLERRKLGDQAGEIFSKKWSGVYPGITRENFVDMTIKDFEGMSKK